MSSPEALQTFAFGISVAVSIYFYVAADHLWKQEFFKNCLIVSVAFFIVGICLDVFRLVDVEPGIASGVMSAPIVYLGYFWLLRFVYKRKYGTEPHITSASSTIGAPPLDMFSSAQKDGKKRKYPKGRRITHADFGFSFLQALAPPFTIIAWIGLVMWLTR